MKIFLMAWALFAADLRLIEAVKTNDIAGVRSMISGRTDVNAAEADGSTALHWAAQRDNLEITNLLLAAGANASAPNRYRVTPLFLASTNGNAAIIDRLLKAGADPNSVSEEGETAVMTASLTGKPDAIRVLLDAGARVDTAEPVRGQTALMWAASEGNTSAAELLISRGADVKSKSKSGFTPLLFAVRNGHIDTVRKLVQHGANANDVSPDGTSAMNMAVVNAYFELAAVLLEFGADPNAPDPRGSALHTLSFLRRPGADGAAGVGNTPKGTPPPTGNMTAIQLAKKLLEHGANPNARIQWDERPFQKEGGTMRNPPLIQLGRHYLTYNGATPFYLAAKNGDPEYMRLLAAHGADPKIKNSLNITPLIVASGLDHWEGETPGPFTGVSEKERIEAIQLAIELGNDVNDQADFGDYKMEGDPAYMLLYYPLNQDVLSRTVQGDPRWSGSSALHASVVSGQPGITKFLLEKGANPHARTEIGWTALDMAGGIFYANAKKDYSAAAALLREAMGSAK
jgi:ankyrin repeat protein